MAITTSSATGTPARAGRKSPLRLARTGGGSVPSMRGLTTADIMAAGFDEQPEAIPAPQLRRMQISEFTSWLRSRTNKHHRPFQADTIAAYADAARALSEWMNGHDVDGDFTACDAEVLNRFSPTTWLVTAKGAPIHGSGTCGTCSPGWRRPSGTRTRGRRSCSGTRR